MFFINVFTINCEHIKILMNFFGILFINKLILQWITFWFKKKLEKIFLLLNRRLSTLGRLNKNSYISKKIKSKKTTYKKEISM